MATTLAIHNRFAFARFSYCSQMGNGDEWYDDVGDGWLNARRDGQRQSQQ